MATVFKAKLSGLDAALLKFGGARKTALPNAAVNALNKAADRGRTRVQQSISKNTVMGRNTVFNKKFGGLIGPKANPGNNAANKKRLVAMVTSRRIGMPMAFYVRNKKRFLSGSAPITEIKKGKKTTWRGARPQVLRLGVLKDSIGVFIRGKRSGRRKHVYSLSISQMFNKEKDRVSPEVQKYLQDEFDRLVDLEFARLAGSK